MRAILLLVVACTLPALETALDRLKQEALRAKAAGEQADDKDRVDPVPSLHRAFRDTNLAGRRIAIQGAGKVGYSLAGLLAAEGADIVVADTNVDNVGRAVREFGVEVLKPVDLLKLIGEIKR